MSSTNPVTKRRYMTQAVGSFIAAASAGVGLFMALAGGREVTTWFSLLVLSLAVGFYSLRAH